MTLLVALLLLNAAPESCEALWPRVWTAWSAKELPGRPPRFAQVPDARARLAAAWIAECRAFSPDALACARGETRETELGALDARLAKEGVPAAERRAQLEKLRGQWSVLECRDVERALDRAGEVAAGAPPSRSAAESPLEYRDVERALDRAAAVAARDGGGVPATESPLGYHDVERAAAVVARDGGVPASDDCAGAALSSGQCTCAHARCGDHCCPAGWVCAHTGSEHSKCVRPRR